MQAKTNHESIDARSGELMLIALSLLVPSPKRNARRTGGTNIDDLKASILAQGLMQNLIVCPAEAMKNKKRGGAEVVQRYEVVGGGRRLRALLALAAEGLIRKDEDILCRVKPTREAAEASLAENVHREPMHPADEFEAFQRLVQDGASVEDVAARFGTSPLTVRRRLKLADLHPELRQLYRDGGIALDQLMALALSDDADEQLAIWNGTPSWCRDAHSLRSRLVSEEVDASSDALARFVGIEAYEAAGGTVRRDLFSERGEGYLQDAALLNRLASDRLEACADELRAEGWGWVEVALRGSTLELYRFGRAPRTKRAMTRAEAKQHKTLTRELAALEKQMAKLSEREDGEGADDLEGQDACERLDEQCDEINARLRALDEGLNTYAPKTLAKSGAIVCVGRDGALQIHRGLIRPQDRKAGKQASVEADAIDQNDGQPKERTKPAHSAALMQELTAHRTLAARAAMLERPDVALTALLHCLLQHVLRDVYVAEPTAVKLVSNAPDAGLFDKAGSSLREAKAVGVLSDARERWGERIPGDADELLPWVASLADAERMDLLALCVALSLNDVHADERPGSLEPLCAMLGLDMADWWQAGQGNYFGRVTKDAILNAIAEGAGADAAARYKGVTKGELARVAERDLAGRRWLPLPLRTPMADGIATVTH